MSEEPTTTATPPPTAWERNATIVVTAPGAAADTVTVPYRVLFAALSLADVASESGVAQRAIEENALPDGFDLAVAGFGSVHPGHRFHLEPVELERAVWLARYFRGETDGAA